MRRSLQWALGLAVLASAAALWIDEAPRLVAPLDRRAAPGVGAVTPSADAADVSPLPARFEPIVLEAAKRDIFVPVAPPALPAPPPPAAPPAPWPPPHIIPVVAHLPAPPPPLEPPVPPPMPYRYLGSMLTPEGKRLVLLVRGETPVPVSAGTRLDEGYVVEAITDEAVRLVWPASGAMALVQIPQRGAP